MSEDADEPTVPIVCSACDTTTKVALSSVAESIDRHNETRHDGEPIAEVDPVLKEQIADLVAEDIGIFDDDA